MNRGKRSVRVWPAIATSAALGVGVLILAWHAETLYLEPGGVNLAWPAILAFGIAWNAADRMRWRVGAGIAVGVAVATVGFYLTLQYLPVSPLGIGIGLGLSAVVAGVVASTTRGWLPLGASAAGFGAGVATSQLTEISATTGASDVLASASAVVFAVLLGVVGAYLLGELLALMKTRPAALPSGQERTEILGALREDPRARRRPMARTRGGSR